MDPGTALGAVSLAFQIFAGCMKGCQLLLEARDFPQEYGYLRHRLHLEQLKLLDWWNASGFTVEATLQDPQLDERRQATVNSLIEIRSLTLEINQIKERYDLALGVVDVNQEDFASEPARLLPFSQSLQVPGKREKLRRKSIRYADTVLKYPKRLRWVAFHADKFEKLLARISELNSSMHFSLELEQRRQYIQLQETTQVQVLRAHDKLDQVIELIRSLYLPLRHGPEGLRQDSDENMFNGLERLARFKALSITVAGGDLSCENGIAAQVGVRVPLLDGLKLAVSQLKFLGNQEENDSQRVLGTFDATSVWIEWKNYDPESTTLACRFIENRIARLTALLLKNPENPERLQLPASLGYVHDPDSTRFGLVFESPVSTDTLGSRSLYARLQTTLKPSLTTRLDIARRLTTSLKYLHVSRWLHKGLRSDNILFLTPSYTSWTPFCLSGFDYSRPADPDEATELPTDRREHDLYRHPDVQFDVPRDGEYGYEEKHDVYSLGVILMEIGLWQPIHQFLGLSLNQLIPRPAIRRARISLLKAESLTILESEAGARFSEAVRLCLAGDIRQPPGEIRSPGMAEEIDHPAFDSIDCLRKVEEILQGITV